jgi:DNA-binding CsgD family transcriptional regulator
MRKIEFYVSPDGKVKVDEDGVPITMEYTESEVEMTEYVAGLIRNQYPEAYNALALEYKASRPNRSFYHFQIVHRFIRCNFGKFDGLTYDIDGDVLHIEDIACPLKWRNDCPLRGVVCRPKPLGLTSREAEVAKLSSTGKTYEEISDELGISHSTIKNTIQKVKEKLHLSSSKEITKLIIATL